MRLSFTLGDSIRPATLLAKLAGLRGIGELGRVGVEKIVVIPALLAILGPTELGLILLALSWSRLLLVPPFSATNNALLRLHDPDCPPAHWGGLVRSGAAVATVGAGTLGIASLTGSALIGGRPVLDHLGYACALGLATIASGLRSTICADLRVRLRFGTLGALDWVEGALLIAAIPLAVRWATSGAVAGFLCAASAALLLAVWINRRLLTRRSASPERLHALTLRTAGGFVVISAVVASLYQSARVILGWVEGPEAVTVFFAAETSVVLLMTPIHFVNTAAFSMLSRKRSVESLGSGLTVQFLAISAVGSAVFLAVALAISPLILRALYSTVAPIAEPLIPALAVGASFRVLYLSSLSFHYRFTKMRTLQLLALSSFVVYLTTTTWLTLAAGMRGTARGVAIGNGIMAAIWVTGYIVGFVLKRSGTGSHPEQRDA